MKKPKEGYEAGVTTIRSEQRNHLNIAVDVNGSDMSIKKDRILILNFTPNMNEHDHYHISLNYEQALKLLKFVNDYVNDVYMFHEGK